MSWLRHLRRDRRTKELADEIESYLEITIDENIAAGMSEDDAILAARRKFGNTTLVKEKVRDMNSLTWLEDFWHDVRYGMRVLRLNPAFFAVATVSLALGIGANTAIFQLLDAVRLRSLPVAEPGQLALVSVAKNDHCCSGNFSARNSSLTYPMWEQIRDRQQGFSGIFAFGDTRFNIAQRGETRFVDGLWLSGGAFKTLGVGPALGRVLDENDDRPGCGSTVAVISYPFWQREFAGDPLVLGKKISLNGQPVEIAGVTAASFFGIEVGRSADVMMPTCAEPSIDGEDAHLAKRQDWWLGVMGRLKPGWTLARAQAQLEAVSPQVFENTVPQNYRPEEAKYYVQYKLAVKEAGSGVSSLRRSYEDPLWMLLGIAGAVLLIACANLANLMLARASVREREMAVRLAIGAGRGRLVRQLLTESALLTVAGTVLGVFLAGVLSRSLVTFLSTSNAPLFLDLAIDWRMLGFTIGVALITCVLFGLTPALRAARTSPGAAMKAGGRSVTADRSRFGLRRALVVGQVALSLVLLTGALLFGRSLRNLATLDAGFRGNGLLITNLDLTNLKFTPERRGPLYRHLLERLRSTPGISQVATAIIVPLSGSGWNDVIEVLGAPPQKNRLVPWFDDVSSGYFETMGIPFIAGRDFNERDTPASQEVAIVNEAFAAKFLKGGGGPVGRQFRIVSGPGQPQHLYEIVGVVKNAKYQSLRQEMVPVAFVAASQDKAPPVGVSLLMRSPDSLGSLAAAAKGVILSENPDILIHFQPFMAQVEDGLLPERLMATLSGFFGLLAAVLATVGLYGVISYMVARRRNEIGVRVALGAGRMNIVQLVIREAAILLAIGLVAGVVIAASGARVTQSLLYGLQAQDPLTIAGAAILLAIVSLCASLLPAMRAARLDPVQALREE
ncbi:MAG TPA: ABC transporter permease [Bryobacteraceae bacterium]|jgi:predicted permease